MREALTELDLDAMIYPSPHGGKRFRPKVAETGGKQQFPFLVDPNSGESMYESADIIDYLYRRYGGRPAPTRLLRTLDVSSSVLAGIPRLRAGARARSSKAPRKPLELFSFESSPYSRRVRELLCELELPYLLRSTGKAKWQDLGPPGLRATLFPNLPVEGRTRTELLERAGKVQVPYLVDHPEDMKTSDAREMARVTLRSPCSSRQRFIARGALAADRAFTRCACCIGGARRPAIWRTSPTGRT